ncbi:MAG: DUF4349 domain-containing protein [Armatimonadetes bacterium]|nr:DUF4349 domain-containing protein [Armatimonadota bacterium]
MDQQPRDEFTSPLDDVFANLPEEQPPADLEARCREVLQSRGVGIHRPRTWAPWRTLMAAAASFVVLVGVTAVMMSVSGRAKPVAPMGPGAAAKAFGTTEFAPTPGGGVQATLPEVENGRPGEGAIAAGSGGGRMGGPAATPLPLASEALRVRGQGRAEDRRMRTQEAAADRVAAASKAAPANSPSGWVGGNEQAMPGEGAAPTKPWRDESGERQRIVHKDMEIEVRNVEQAHEQAASIIEKADGYVDSEAMEVLEDAPDYAHITARVPVKALDGVVAQLRRLGKVTRLVGEGEDRTREYVAGGGEIRGAAEDEMQLVERYEKERDRQRKQQLYRQIQALRERNKARKEQLLRLSDQTHYATLDLTLTEAGGAARRFLAKLGDNALKVLSWVGATAVIWLPLLTVGYLLWRRRAVA